MCGNLRFVTLPDTVEQLQAKMFYECNQMEGICYLWKGTKLPYLFLPFTPRGLRMAKEVQKGQFSWEKYDGCFERWGSQKVKLAVALYRLRYREGLLKEREETYRKYLMRYGKKVAEAAILADDVDTLGFLCEQQLLPKRHMDFFVDVSAKQQGRCTALLLQQQKKTGQSLKKRFQL